MPAKDVVPGDIVILEAGDMVVADGRILENFSLQVNESSLTGESESVNKFIETIEKEELIKNKNDRKMPPSTHQPYVPKKLQMNWA